MAALLLVLPSMMLSSLAFAQGRPVFDYPVDNQRIGDRAPWQFKVQPMANVQKFSWSVFQDGRMLSERIKGNEFEIYPGDENFSQIIVGRPIEVRVRASIRGIWTDPTIITVRAYDPPPVKASQPTSSAVEQQPGQAAQPPSSSRGWLWLFLFLPLGLLIYAISRRPGAKDAKLVEGICNRATYKALYGLPDGLKDALKQPVLLLCSGILSYEGYGNRLFPIRGLDDILELFVRNLLFDEHRRLWLGSRLFDGRSDAPVFSVTLYTLHDNVAEALGALYDTIKQKLPPPHGRPFSRLTGKTANNLFKASGIKIGPTGYPASEAERRKPVLFPRKLKDKHSAPELIDIYLTGTPFVKFFQADLPVSIPLRSRFEHMHIVGGSGHGKTQLLQYLILHDLPHVAAGNRSVIVIDSQGSDSERGLIKNILSLASVGDMAERVVLIDPKEYIPALNLFDFGLDRLKGYADLQKRKQVINGAIELYAYMFGALLRAEVTMRQGVIFTNLARLMMVVPGATIRTLRDFMRQPELTRPYIPKLDDDSRDFFETEFFASKYNDTREQLLDRLWGVTTQTELASMFAAKHNKLDMFSAMNRGSLILISTNKRHLNQDASAIFGRFFIALIRQAIRERELGDQDKLRDTFVYIDEAHEYFDKSMGSLFEQARKFQVGMVIAHQHLGQLKEELRDSVTGNTAVKIAGGVSYDDARDFAKEMNCEKEFIQSMRKHEEADDPYTEFACSVKDKTDRAIALKVPFGKMGKQPQMTAARLASLKEANRAQYGITNEKPPDKPRDDDSPLGDPELL